MTISKVAVIGAGLAGLTCARELLRAGLAVTIYDKGRHVGGRLASRDRDVNTFDYGAQYFTVRDPDFAVFVHRLIADNLVEQWTGWFGKYKDGALHAEGKIHPRYVGVPSMRTLAESLTASICTVETANKKQQLFLQHKVTRIIKDGDKWALSGTKESKTNEEQEEFCADGYDFIVLNMPPAQAQALQPHKLLTEQRMQPCKALQLAFRAPVALGFDGINITDEVLSWVARDSSKPGRGLGERWVLHAAPDWSAEHWDDSSDNLSQTLTDAFATIFGITLPQITFNKLHKWRYALPVTPLSDGYIIEPERSLAYCGDWCDGARVESAYLSGLKVAQAICQLINSEERP